MSGRPSCVVVSRMGNSRRRAATSSGAMVDTSALDGYEDVTVLDSHVVRPDRFDGGEPRRAAARHVEARAVPHAFDRTVVDRSCGQREVAVRAVVLKRVNLAVG